MADRIVLNTISYHGHGAIENIVPELTVTLTPQSVTAESASEHSIRPVRFFCIVIHLLGQSYVRTCADMT